MTVTVFSGGAGSGKTYHLMQRLAEVIAQESMAEGCKVLALTFMHGSRRRLDDRLAGVPGLARRYDCTTLDSFAARIVRRWQSLATHERYGEPRESDYEETCRVAGALLAHREVVLWVKASYPTLIIDEAQDLSANRLDIVRHLSKELTTLIAADEFQCLDPALRPNPAWEWLQLQEDHVKLDRTRRTNVGALLDAAAALRSGVELPVGRGFSFRATANAALASTFLNNQIGWKVKGKTLAVISPVVKAFAEGVVELSGTRATKGGNGPYRIGWEQAEAKVVEALLAQIVVPAMTTAAGALDAVRALRDPALYAEVSSWIDRLVRTRREVVISRQMLSDTIKQICANRARFQRSSDFGYKAMSVHRAKNREFDHVVVLWPAATSGDNEQKRRLLYNAVTRAKEECIVLVQAQKQLDSAPFKQ
ncbi:ATP-dependent helicase [Xanthomonas campestris pv. campestris]|uniref:ATP-binding domain-containing protein n=1 Tax=Xanthomonas campestris TaxID=339 RepID=UPI001F1E2C18|nr:ATP-dependent helicase [Xanthomonas campestris]MCF8839725.1 ATP-dependent helicase [Xanthomonas campestris pv. campestris]MDO0880261.1 ATP-dependent helicase [Xanthomonas campestris pv. campestris]MEA0633587.1 ATP-dependent helicase [Xanthomonas campestris pv. campestris]MEA0649571.1 ATP-dependent helicase [Xanthomonas campestris pv. campestris]MEA0653510.1 ATP-dependent helicase [Xanthomonas campestris pv. campestris]